MIDVCFMRITFYLSAVLLAIGFNMACVANEKVMTDTPAADRSNLAELERLSRDIQALKHNVIDLNRDLLELEEQLLYPSSTKYSVFVTMNSSQFFTLESIKLKLDGKLVASHLYDRENRDALTRGGVHKLFVTNLSEGEHTATVFFTGLGPNDTPYKRATELNFTKRAGQGFLEVAIVDNGDTQEAEFELHQW